MAGPQNRRVEAHTWGAFCLTTRATLSVPSAGAVNRWPFTARNTAPVSIAAAASHACTADVKRGCRDPSRAVTPRNAQAGPTSRRPAAASAQGVAPGQHRAAALAGSASEAPGRHHGRPVSGVHRADRASLGPGGRLTGTTSTWSVAAWEVVTEAAGSTDATRNASLNRDIVGNPLGSKEGRPPLLGT